MDRRRYLAISSALFAGVAGCSESSNEIDDPQAAQTETDDGSNDGQETEDTTPNESEGEADVEFGDRKMLTDDSGFSAEKYVEVVVENVGDGPAGQITVTVDWFDADDNYLEETEGRIPSLEAGEVWVAQVSALTSDTENIKSFEITGEFEDTPPVAPSGMQVTESELEIDDFSTQISGVAENTRDGEMDYVEAHGKIYDDQGRVIGGGWTNETEIPAGSNWAFEILLSGRAAVRAENATEHTAFLNANSI